MIHQPLPRANRVLVTGRTSQFIQTIRQRLSLSSHKMLSESEAKSAGFQVVVDNATKFHGYVYVFGWFFHPNTLLTKIFLRDRFALSHSVEVGLEHLGVSTLGTNLGFRLEVARTIDFLDGDLILVFVTSSGQWFERRLIDLCEERVGRSSTVGLLGRFRETIRALPRPRMLDLGGRSRSGVDRSKDFPFASTTVFDIHEGENVDVVGDAHQLSNFFEAESFDAVFCISVFEHLAMPWVVALEINKVLRLGGIALIHSHQTLGLHDAPWDYWRFSDEAWRAIFNLRTGFRIIETCMDSEQYVLPFVWRPTKQSAEKSCGFEGSTVWVEKIGNASLRWDMSAGEIANTSYPLGSDGQDGKRDLF